MVPYYIISIVGRSVLEEAINAMKNSELRFSLNWYSFIHNVGIEHVTELR